MSSYRDEGYNEIERGLTLSIDLIAAAAPTTSAADESGTCSDALSYRPQSRKTPGTRPIDRPIRAVEPQSVMGSSIDLESHKVIFRRHTFSRNPGIVTISPEPPCI